jgi:caffeic acid 3-O-methyltransferase
LGEDAFELAYGMNEFEYMHSHPEHLSIFQAAMTDHANQMLPLLLAKYQGFRPVRKLMDVGGGEGTILARILARHPHLQGVNFDLPEVIATAPRHRGVEPVGGDMFHSIPSGCDAIFMKVITISGRSPVGQQNHQKYEVQKSIEICYE